MGSPIGRCFLNITDYRLSYGLHELPLIGTFLIFLALVTFFADYFKVFEMESFAPWAEAGVDNYWCMLFQ